MRDVRELVNRFDNGGDLSRHEVSLLVAALEAAWGTVKKNDTAMAQMALDTVERPCMSKDVGAPGSIMRRANDLGRRLLIAEDDPRAPTMTEAEAETGCQAGVLPR
jgi:hypothetical protein